MSMFGSSLAFDSSDLSGDVSTDDDFGSSSSDTFGSAAAAQGDADIIAAAGTSSTDFNNAIAQQAQLNGLSNTVGGATTTSNGNVNVPASAFAGLGSLLGNIFGTSVPVVQNQQATANKNTMLLLSLVVGVIVVVVIAKKK